MRTTITIYRSHLKNPGALDKGMALLEKLVAEATSGELEVRTFIQDTGRVFSFQVSADGTSVKGQEILELPGRGKVVCLVHGGNFPPTTNPFHTLIELDGRTPIQIPEEWYAGYHEVFAEFCLHELLHAWCYLLNRPDKVHSPGPNWGGLGTPTKYYLSLLLELKPYWNRLEDDYEEERLEAILKAIWRLAEAFGIQMHERPQAKDFLLSPPEAPVASPTVSDWGLAIKEYENMHPSFNNPGALRSSPFQAGTRNGFAWFRTYEEGWNALLHQLRIAVNGQSRWYGPDDTLLTFFAKYAPKDDGNDPVAYAFFVAHKLGVEPGVRIGTFKVV